MRSLSSAQDFMAFFSSFTRYLSEKSGIEEGYGPFVPLKFNDSGYNT